jgi:xanthine/CO dehydrogenase XdhC/CoxF family maturation factor
LPRKLLYLGILGPRHRTERLLAEVVPSLGLSIEEGFERLHSPVGLDLGGGDPAAVALSIVAEIQAVLHGRSVEVSRSRVPARGAEPDGDPAAGAGANVGADPDGEAVPGNFATTRAKDHLA